MRDTVTDKQDAMNAKIPDTMRAVAIDRFGGAERITLQTLPVPKAGPDEIVIRIETAGVAVWDTFGEREVLRKCLV